MLAVGEAEGGLRLLRVHDGRLLFSQRAHARRTNGVAFSRDGQLLASAGWDHKVALWSVPEGKRVRALVGQDLCNTVAFSPDGGTLASAGNDCAVKLWDIGRRPRPEHSVVPGS